MSLSSYYERTRRSKELYQRASRVIPGGATYGIRDYDPYPFYAARGEGSRLVDLDGNAFIDFWCGHFVHILGHSYPKVVEAIREQVGKGIHLGVCHELEVEHAEQVQKVIPCAERVKFTNTGTEANMYAVRLARSYTRRLRVGKFIGGWHGGYDGLHVAVNPPFNKAESGGLPKALAENTVLLDYNDLDSCERKIRRLRLACVLIEPVMGAAGFVPAEDQFLKGLKEVCDDTGTLLIFDEVITGFRLSRGGGQEFYNVVPDLAVLGKIMGGGFPIGGVVGRRDVMDLLDHRKHKPPRRSFIGGTYVGNPMSMIAGRAVLKELENEEIYTRINRLGDRLRAGLQKILDNGRFPGQVTGAGSLFGMHFTKKKRIRDAKDAARDDRNVTEHYHQFLLANGIFMVGPRNLHAALSYAHTEAEVERLVAVTEAFVKTASR